MGSERTQGIRWLLWLGLLAFLMLSLGVCLVGAYFLLKQFQSRTEAPPALVIPTSSASSPAAVTLLPPTMLPSPTALPLAATATLNRPEATATSTGSSAAAGAVEARRFSVPPTIDGNLSEWEGFTIYRSSHLVHRADSWDGSDDVLANWRLGWDTGRLYIAVEVVDDIHVQTQTGNQIFRGDGVDMQFDTNRAADYGPGLSPDDFQIVFSPGDFDALPPSAFRFQGTGQGRILDAPGEHGIILSALPASQGYQLEAAIPWSSLNVTPAPGMTIGVALNVNDNDRPATAVQEVMKSHVASRTLTDPTTWGTLTLR